MVADNGLHMTNSHQYLGKAQFKKHNKTTANTKQNKSHTEALFLSCSAGLNYQERRSMSRCGGI